MPLNNEPNKFGKITVQIEEVDESWALKLLNESELEDNSYIRVNTEAKDLTAPPLSAIEYQILEQQRKNRVAGDDRQNPKNLKLSFAKFKDFFVA